MAHTVAIAYDGFGDIRIEQEILSSIHAEVVHIRTLTSPEARNVARNADALMVTIERVPADLIAEMQNCLIISRVGTGLDAIDIPAATERGIWVTYVPDYAVEEVSTHAIALLLAHARGIPRLLESTRNGQWSHHMVAPLRRLQCQTLGILGFGCIGQATAKKAIGLGLEVQAYDPNVSSQTIESFGARAVDCETLLRTSDYISLHAPLLDSTRNIIDSRALSLMKPTAVLINTARGGLVDEDALLEALQAGRIAGAAIDVLSVEPPPPNHPFRHEPRVMLTPHCAWYSEEANRDVRVRGAEEVVRVFRGERPRYPANMVLNR